MKPIVFFDIDGTMAEWRDVSLSELYRKGYFTALKPTPVAECANKLAVSKQIEVYSLSAYFTDSHAYDEKNEWSDIHTPNIDRNHRIFVPYGVSKAAFIMEAFRRPLTDDYILVDDYTANLIDWQAAGGVAIKWLNGINGNRSRFMGPRVMEIEELERIISDSVA